MQQKTGKHSHTAKDSHYARLRRQHRDNMGQNKDKNQRNIQQRPVSAGKLPPAGRFWLYGFHTVEAALDNPRRIFHRLFLTKNAYERLKRQREAANMLRSDSVDTALNAANNTDSQAFSEKDMLSTVPIQIISSKELENMLGSDAVHQGIALETEPLQPQRRNDFSDSSLVLLLDQITDPHNVGAIMRSAVAFNVDFFITTLRHSPQETGVLAKSASGALEKIDHLTVRNLAETLEVLNKSGFQTVGLDSEGEKAVETCLRGKKIALVLGAEGKGLRQKTRHTVSDLARLDVPGAIKSLNVSNAAAITLYAAHRHLKNL